MRLSLTCSKIFSQKQFLQRKLLFLPPRAARISDSSRRIECTYTVFMQSKNKRFWANRPVFGTPCKFKNLETSTKNVFYIEYSDSVVRLKKSFHNFYVVKKTSVFGQTVPYLAPPVNPKTLKHVFYIEYSFFVVRLKTNCTVFMQ